MDAKGVDRPVVVVVGGCSPLTEALCVELARRGHDVHLPDELAQHVAEHRYPARRWHPSPSPEQVLERVADHWSVAVVSGAHDLGATLVERGSRWPRSAVLVVAEDAGQLRWAEHLEETSASGVWVTVVGVRPPSAWGRLVPQRSHPDPAGDQARSALRGLAERRARVWVSSTSTGTGASPEVALGRSGGAGAGRGQS